MHQNVQRLQTPGRVPIGSVVMFRVAFGILLCIELWRYLALGWVDRYFSPLMLHFPYAGFDWVQALPGYGMHLLFGFLGFSALGIAFGWHYRVCSIIVALGFSYIFLIDKANYLNHFYLIVLLSWLLCIMPTHQAFSIDARNKPIIASDTIRLWCLQILKFQFAVAFLFEGVFVPPDSDGEPLTSLLWTQAGWAPAIYDALPADLLTIILVVLRGTLVVGLFFRWTWLICVAALLSINLLKAHFLDLGIHPWLLIAGLSLFLPANWPHFYQRLWPGLDDRLFPVIYYKTSWLRKFGFASVLGIYVLTQLAIPLQSFIDISKRDWLLKSARFAWSEKPHNHHGTVRVYVRTNLVPDRSEVALGVFLTHRQIRMLHLWPDLLEDFAFFLKAQLENQGHREVGVFAKVSYSGDGKVHKLLTNPNINILSHSTFNSKWKPWRFRKPYLFLQSKSS